MKSHKPTIFLCFSHGFPTNLGPSRLGAMDARLGLLGCGGFGAVELVEEVKSGDVSLGGEMGWDGNRSQWLMGDS